MTYAIRIPSSPCSGVPSRTRDFTIIANDNGYNDSVEHYQPGNSSWAWPVMNVNRCDFVKITIINTDTQTHGFSIAYYALGTLQKGTEIPGQQTLLFPTFQAVKAGRFQVYCTVLCTVHWAMLNGLLIVS
jgi:heme/copper-type cytochrome/quinol oxidase subunit 2